LPRPTLQATLLFVSLPFKLYCARCGEPEASYTGPPRVCSWCGSTSFIDDDRTGIDVGRPIRERWARRGTRGSALRVAIPAVLVAVAILAFVLLRRR
jgi:hypothetical protein